MKRFFSPGIISAVILLMLATSTPAQQILRGPYLQNPTSSSMVVRWRTDSVSNSRVYYGTALSSLTNYVDNPVSTTEHSVKITGLAPFTKYFYSIGSTGNIHEASDSSHHFVTSPLGSSTQPIRIWAIGDFGKGNAPQKAVMNSYLNYTGNTHTDVWMWLGDNAYSEGTDAEYQAHVFDSVFAFHKIMKYMPFMPVPGNHDYRSVCTQTCITTPPNHKGPYYDIVDVPKNGEAGGVASGYELYYSYDYGNVHFVALNSELSSVLPFAYNWTGANPTSSFNCANSPMCQWLHNDLQANNKTFTVVYFHQPPYTDGSHDAEQFWEVYMKAMRENFVPIFEQYGVDVVVCGHSHVYERSYLLKGHYSDPSTFDPNTMIVDSSSGKFSLGEAYIKDPTKPKFQNGTVYVVAGNSGSKDDSAPLGYPAMYFDEGCASCFGSFIMDVNGDRLDGKYLRVDGTIGDEFTIIKSAPVNIYKNSALFSKLKVYPNPFISQTTVEYTLKKSSGIMIELFDMIGSNIFTIDLGDQVEGEHKFILDAEKMNIAKGVYLIKIHGGANEVHESVVKVE